MTDKIKQLEAAIVASATGQRHIEAAAGVVRDADKSLTAADIRQIKEEIEDTLGQKFIRKGRPDAVTAKFVRGVILDAVQRTLIVTVGA